jgi:Flp pilus assembly protein TadB
MSNRRRERERRRRIAHTPVVPISEREPRPERAPSSRKSQQTSSSSTSKRKPVPAPSLQRSAKRAALVFVVLTALIYVVDSGKHSIGADALQAILGAAVFVPFDYLLTRVMYRRLGSRVNPNS